MANRRQRGPRKFETMFYVVATVFFVAVVAPDALSEVLSGPSVWHVVTVAPLLFAILALTALPILGRRLSTPEPIDVEDVDPDEVRNVLESTPGRIASIKALRERHPGLGLKDAVDLIDRASSTSH